jgi:zinc protease
MGDVESALDEVLTKLVAEGVTADEVERTKTRMRAAAVFARDSLQAGARVIGTALTTGQTIEDVESWPDRIEAVTKEDVDRAARYLLQPERSVTGLLLPKPSS